MQSLLLAMKMNMANTGCHLATVEQAASVTTIPKS